MRNFITTLLIGFITTTSAQNISDAVRYSTAEIEGTARFRSMGGAFGALGGNLSAFSLNPAGSAVFIKSHGAVSLSSKRNDNNTRYGSGITNQNESKIDFNQIGGVFVFKSGDNKNTINKFAIGVNYEQLQNYSDSFIAAGNTSTSIGSYFTSYADGLRLDQISAFPGESVSDAYSEIGYNYGYANQQAFLGYESYILEPNSNDDENTQYSSNIAPGIYTQEYIHNTSGSNGKLTFNIGFQHNKNFHFGININSHSINYERYTFLREVNNNPASYINNVNFENTLFTTGEGISAQLGAIAKLGSNLRFGLVYESPTWLTLRDETTQSLATSSNTDNSSYVINPNTINLFSEYKLKTPEKLMASAAVVGKNFLISVDYSRKDFSNTRYTTKNSSYFTYQNQAISNSLAVANTLKIGGELRHANYSFRAGYSFEESPYVQKEQYGDLKGTSFGIGYNFGNTQLDLSYENSQRSRNHNLYDQGLTNAANLNTETGILLLSLSINL